MFKIPVLNNFNENNTKFKLIMLNKSNDQNNIKFKIPVLNNLNNENKISKIPVKKIPSKKYKKSINNGFIYVLYNEVYDVYGNNVFKIGCSNQPGTQIRDFDSAYIESSNTVYTYEHKNAEMIVQRVVDYLGAYQLCKTRKFFKCQLPIITDVIEQYGKFYEFIDSEP